VRIVKDQTSYIGAQYPYGFMGSIMPKQSDQHTAWQSALDRFREARRARNDWNRKNPFPPADGMSVDPSQELAAAEKWEQGVEAVNEPYSDAVEALRSIPAPTFDAIVVKLSLVRAALDGYEVERELRPFIRSIERDIKRLARQSL
jgi:hypothetical protein